MSEELDRKIAELVMGEEEPPALRWGNEPWLDIPVFEDGSLVSADEWKSEGGNWRVVSIFEHRDQPEWHPVPFSSVLAEALRAVDKRLADRRKEYPRWLVMEYHPEHPEDITFGASFGTKGDPFTGTWGYGQTLPEAICKLLLALKTEKA